MNIHIKNVAAVVPMDEILAVETTDIFIEDNIIASVGDMPEDFKADKIIDGENKLAIPGLINAHTHAYMTLFRNLADDLSFHDWLFRSIFPLEDVTGDEEAYWGAKLGFLEMIKHGTTAFLDMDLFPWGSIKAACDIGIRGVFGRGLVGNGKNDPDGLRRIGDLKYGIEHYGENPLISFAVAPHAIYTTDREYLELCAELAGELHLPVHTHVSETVKEVEDSYAKFGVSPVEYIEQTGLFDHDTVAAHCVHVSEKDIEILARHGVTVAHNPRSNLKLSNGIAPIPAMQKAGINVALGTDGASSNNALNLFSDMNYAALLHKGTTHDPLVASAETVFRMATENGARALHLNAGSLEAGNKADVVLLDLNKPQFVPRHNLIAALAYSANGTETDTVIIDGKVVLEAGRLLTADEEEIYAKVEKSLAGLKRKAGQA
jgi:5-methylthioadenosine/S-adenosylhomocysteine deaminase